MCWAEVKNYPLELERLEVTIRRRHIQRTSKNAKTQNLHSTSAKPLSQKKKKQVQNPEARKNLYFCSIKERKHKCLVL